MSRELFEGPAREAARRHGVPEEMFLRLITQESGWRPDAVSPAGAVGLLQIIPHFHPDVDPWDPLASINYAAAWLSQRYRQYGSWQKPLIAYNWGEGNLRNWNGQPGSLPAETRHYLDVILGQGWPEPGATSVVTYNRDQPAFSQNDPWSCAPTSTRWAMWALGRRPTEAWLEETMIAEGVVSQELGLLDATGAGLAKFIVRHYGEYGYLANNEAAVSFDWAVHEGAENPDGSAHGYPVLIGGRAWGEGGHWSGLRDCDPARGLLLLANPAPGYDGVNQTMNRAQWSANGPWSAVRVYHPDLVKSPVDPDTPPPTEDLEKRVHDLTTALSELTRGGVKNAIADLRDKELDEVVGEVDHILARLDALADQFGIP